MTNKNKNQFHVNGKMVSSIACIAAVLTFSQAAAVFASADTGIGSEAAQNYAFADAGVDPAAADYVVTEYDYDDDYGLYIYDVEFTAGGTEYEYHIHAYDGSIRKKSLDYESLKRSLAASGSTGTSITLAEAEEIALADAGLTEEEKTLVTFTEEKSDYDDGLSVYDLEFFSDTTAYDYEISADTGDILSFSTEVTAVSGSTGTGSAASASDDSYISVEEAKTVALETAGLSASEVTFKKAKLDKEDGSMVYEIEFYQGQMEYEFEINATTGAVLKYEKDWDD
ncbi:MAG: PepSY domain-containing protein [Clostridiales bacterium]|nr:PepSY domain-containing protein [Clostridiales bacterium]